MSAVSAVLDELVGPVVQRTVTGERHAGGVDRVCLRRRPVGSVSSVKVWQSGVSTTLTAETLSTAGGYVAELDPDDPTLLSGVLLRRSSWSTLCWESGTVEVTYSAGRYADTAAVKGSRFHTAAVLTLKSVWRGEEDTVGVVNDFDQPQTAIPTFMVPRAARELLADQLDMRGFA